MLLTGPFGGLTDDVREFLRCLDGDGLLLTGWGELDPASLRTVRERLPGGGAGGDGPDGLALARRRTTLLRSLCDAGRLTEAEAGMLQLTELGRLLWHERDACSRSWPAFPPARSTWPASPTASGSCRPPLAVGGRGRRPRRMAPGPLVDRPGPPGHAGRLDLPAQMSPSPAQGWSRSRCRGGSGVPEGVGDTAGLDDEVAGPRLDLVGPSWTPTRPSSTYEYSSSSWWVWSGAPSARGGSGCSARLKAPTVELHRTVGPAATRINEVARRAGVQRMTVCNHFPDEASLLAACSAHWRALAPSATPTPPSWPPVPRATRPAPGGLDGHVVSPRW